MSAPEYVYVASSWRNPTQSLVIAALADAGIPAYDFRNPEGGTGFSWAEVKTPGMAASQPRCEHCGQPIAYTTFAGSGHFDIDLDPATDAEVWRHANGYAVCGLASAFAVPKKGSDWETAEDYIAMLDHPRSRDGFASDFAAMHRADAFVMVLPCGKSAHLELGWAVGAGKRTAILLEDPIEPELMYRMVDHLSPSIEDLIHWLAAGAA